MASSELLTRPKAMQFDLVAAFSGKQFKSNDLYELSQRSLRPRTIPVKDEMSGRDKSSYEL